MDVADYLPMFLAEASEHLQELNLAVVRIEEDPADVETVNEIFRIAHSFKGMSATMGFEGIAAVTHKMEDVFELLRQRTGGLHREAIDVVLDCLDALSAAVDSIRAGEGEQIEPAPLVARLEGLVRQRRSDQPAPPPPPAAAPDLVREALAAGERVIHVRADLAEDVAMPSVRAYMLLAALGGHGDLLASAPGEDAVDDFTGRVVDAWLISDDDAEAIRATAAGSADVAGAAVTNLAGGGPAPGPAAGAPRKSQGSAVVRVDAQRLDQLMHLMGELVVHRTRVESLAAESGNPELSAAVKDLQRSSQNLQATVMQVRMVPVEAVFLRFPRLVRDLSTRLGKDIELKLVGQDTELDRTVVDTLGDPLVHLVRNALDHGCETPAEREAAGKPPTATLEIAARHLGGKVVIEVRDDGRGIDPAKVAAVAATRGLIDAAEARTVDMARAIELLFTAGFSTTETTSDISGRGVGMDVVRSSIRELGGEVIMTSELGAGTTAQIRLPLTLAIVSTLLVEAAGHPYALPLDRVEQTLRLDADVVRSVAGRRVLSLRDGVLPLCAAADALGAPSDDERFAVIVRSGERRLALAVDSLLGQRELVTRPLPPSIGTHAGLSGGAVLADGTIALIVDCDAVAA
jgi:two-component system chemotaxis sensor kinase CheA